ncbi:A-kinase anchor protein 1, mitochondrial-like [Buteo buteo]|uniref:A-kinase anchor protein 1, mitochondrial-like n=1 Tax=Buteo buteo TaxID=30397 RepID=UPI003EBBE97B
MASRFRNIIPYAIPGVLALVGCWWIYSRRKKHASYHDKQAIATEEEQQEEAPENDSPPKTEACVPRRLPLSSEEECRENETSTSLLSAGSTTPSLLSQTHERLDLSQDLPDLSVVTTQPSTLEDDSEKLETTGSQDESGVPACVSLPLISKSTECHGSAALSLVQDSSSSANQDQWPSASATLTRESLGIVEDGPGLNHERRRAAEVDGDRSGGLDVNSVDFVDSGCAMRKTVSRQNSKLRGESSKSGVVIWEIEVPKELVGRLIGKQGKFMSFLRQSSGAKIYVSTLPYFRDSQVCHIEGSSQQVEKVLSLIGKKFKELCLTNIYALPPPTPLTLHSLLMTAWLFLPDGVSVEVVVANQVDAGHMFLQQHTHPTFHGLRSLDQQMYACYSQLEIPTLPTPVEVGIICAAPGLDGAWFRAQVISYFEETGEVELRYVDYGGYDKVKIDTLRQIRSDFLSLPFQGAEVLLDNVVPLPDEDHFSPEADAAVSEMTKGAVLVAQVTNYDSATGLPLIQLWNLTGDEVVSVNRSLVERGFAQWLNY